MTLMNKVYIYKIKVQHQLNVHIKHHTQTEIDNTLIHTTVHCNIINICNESMHEKCQMLQQLN